MMLRLHSCRADKAISQPDSADDRGVLLTRIAELQGVVRSLRSAYISFDLGFDGLPVTCGYARIRVPIRFAYT